MQWDVQDGGVEWPEHGSCSHTCTWILTPPLAVCPWPTDIASLSLSFLMNMWDNPTSHHNSKLYSRQSPKPRTQCSCGGCWGGKMDESRCGFLRDCFWEEAARAPSLENCLGVRAHRGATWQRAAVAGNGVGNREQTVAPSALETLLGEGGPAYRGFCSQGLKNIPLTGVFPKAGTKSLAYTN